MKGSELNTEHIEELDGIKITLTNSPGFMKFDEFEDWLDRTGRWFRARKNIRSIRKFMLKVKTDMLIKE